MSAIMARRYHVRALAQLAEGEFDDACRDFQAAIQLAPGFAEARAGYARALLGLSDAPRAVQTLRNGLLHDPLPRERALLLRALVDALLATGDYPGAEQALSEAARGGADSADLHDRLARLRARTGRFAEAFDELLRAARLTAPPG